MPTLTNDIWDIRFLKHKIEATEGTDANPDNATDALQIINGTVQIQTEDLERNIDQPRGGAKPRHLIRRRGMVTGELELVGHATAGTAAPIGQVLQTCGYAENLLTADPGPPEIFDAAQYFSRLRPIPSGTSYFYHDGELFQLVGVRGRLTSVNLAINAYPIAGIELMGKVDAISEADVPAGADLSAFEEPRVGTEDETAGAFANMSVLLDGTALDAISLELDPGMTLAMRYSTEATRAIQRLRAISGTLRVYRPLVADSDIRSISRSHARVPLVVDYEHDDAQWRQNHLFPAVQLGEPQLVDVDGDKAWDIPIVALPDAGDDDHTITFGQVPDAA